MKRISVISLGCPKNTVDSEKILGILADAGYTVSAIVEESDFVIVNTCAFIQPAVDESREVISGLKRKKKKCNFKIIVTGCLPCRDYSSLSIEEDIDAIIGPYYITRLPEILSDIESGKKIRSNPGARIENYCMIPRLISTMPYGYLKITEGCNNCCSYCTIPMIRGPLVSFSEKDILKEAEALYNLGVKELIVVGHDITAYGKDKGKSSITALIKKILKIGFPWIRLMYLHPSGITDELLELIAENKQICRYLDVPLQHINPHILKKMNRPVVDCGKLIEKIRKAIPEIALRTTFIVGFPGETEEIFCQLIEFVKDVRFERLGAFIYYPEKGTRAYMLDNHIPEEIKKERFFNLMDIQRKISKEIASSFKGKILDVIIEKKQDNHFLGRTQMDAPDIDWSVKVHGKAKLGDILKVRITKAFSFGLSGFICD